MAVQSGLLDPLPLETMTAFRANLPAALDRDAAGVLRTIAGTGKLDAGTREVLKRAITRLAASLSDGGQDKDATDENAEATVP